MFNLRNIDLNLLPIFEAIYELRSVSAAADRLALSQPASSHALSRLRHACRDELFFRAPQGLSPTPVALRHSQIFLGATRPGVILRCDLRMEDRGECVRGSIWR
jgi:hypothetical protein